MLSKCFVVTLPLGFVLALLLVLGWHSGGAVTAAITQRVSVDSSGQQAVGALGSDNPAITPNGRFVAFASGATNLVSGDTNGENDVFVHDRQTGNTQRVSVDGSGNEGDGGSYNPDLSGDGRYVAFESSATNLVLVDTNGLNDIFVHDRQTGATERVSVASNGDQSDGDSSYPSISSNGRYVAFLSSATNLVTGDTNGNSDVFVHDRQTGLTERVSVNNAGQQESSDAGSAEISEDGRYVAFDTDSALVAGDTNGKPDVFIRDRQAHTTERVSVSSGGTQANDSSFYPGMSPDGRYVVFQSRASNLVSGDGNAKQDIFVRDRQAGTTQRVSLGTGGIEPNDGSYDQAISADGRFVLFDTRATNVVAGDNNSASDVFVRDRQAGTTEMVSVNNSGQQGDNESYGSDYPNTLSGDGRYLAIMSDATNLVTGDTNGVRDIFVRDRGVVATPTPSPTHTPTPTPSATATPSPTPTHSPTPTPTGPTPSPGPELVQGNVNCIDAVDMFDLLALIRFVAHLAAIGDLPAGCPPIGGPDGVTDKPWGDLNCDGFVNALDPLRLVTHLATIDVLIQNCVQIGDVIS